MGFNQKLSREMSLAVAPDIAWHQPAVAGKR
jgi:hypothetical protein